MKLTWKPRTGATGTPVVLGDSTRGTRSGPGSKVILSLRPAFAQVVQVNAFPRADEVETWGRGNVQSTITAVISYEFRTPGECSAWFFRLAELFAIKQGILEIDHGNGYRSVTNAVWQSLVPPEVIGVAVTAQFSFVGGIIRPGTATSSQVGVNQT